MFNWLTQWFTTQRNRLRPTAPHLQRVAVHNSYHMNPPVDTASPRVYEQSPWVYIAINRIAEAGALVPLNVYRREGEQQVAIDNHPLEQLLNMPNPVTSRFELFEQTLGSLELTGNAYWFLSGDALGQPREIWVLRPDRVTIVPDPTNVVRGYLYAIDGEYVPLDAVEVIHFRRWHPGNDYYGLSPISSAQTAIVSDKHMAHWNRNTFGQDNGVPAGIVNIKDFISDTDFERVKREWRNNYGGTGRKTAFLRGGAVEWQNIGLSHTDLDFLQGRKAQRDEILNIFGIPVGLVSENATEANAKVAERMFIERTLYPKLVRLAQKITQELTPFYGENLVAEFEDIRPTDAQARLDDIRTAYPLMSINELRARYYQLPPVAWGELPVGADQATQADTSQEPESEPDAQKTVQDELAQWERFALNRLDRPDDRPFEVEIVPDELAFEVSAGLLFAGDKDAVKSVFASAREMVTTE